MEPMLSRRAFVGALAAAGAASVAGCRAPPGEAARDGAESNGTASNGAAPSRVATSAAADSAMTVYRDPSCGCCEAWADIARKAGYQLMLIDHADMPAIKRQFGVPDELLSCHTAVANGYAIEGHVPIEDVRRLLKDRPARLRGIAVAGMPLGSPGMEVPDGTSEPFQVMAFDSAGRISTYRNTAA